MENEENQSETVRPFYQCVKSSTAKGFIQQLNKARRNGYKPIWDTREDSVDTNYQPPIVNRNVIVYDSESLELDNTETSKRVLISEDIMESEFQYSQAKNQLKNRETTLLKDTDWETVGMEEYQTVKPTVKQKESYIYQATSLEREWLENVERWMKHVKRLEKIHERAEGNPPWIKEPEIEADTDKVFVEKIGEPEQGE